jgi:DinB superfamily
MKGWIGVAVAGLALAPAMVAQDANPVVSSAKEIYTRQAAYIVAAAEEMPADKFQYKPTPEQMTFAKIISHVAQSNGGLCGMLSDTPAPATVKVAETASKEELVAAVKASFAYCDTTMAGLTDAKLGDTITFFGGAKKPRVRALIEITGDLEDHYSQMAGYLRLNGLLPPSAKPKK